jgi:thiol-disulfide isomerase/thioredoxin
MNLFAVNPVLALREPGGAHLFFLTYCLGAATLLTTARLFGRRFPAHRSVRWSKGQRGLLGLAAIAGVAMIWFGLNTNLFSQFSLPAMSMIEQRFFARLRNPPGPATRPAGHALTPPAELSGPLLSLLGTQQWLNSPPLRPEDLRGKVVVVNIWTYSCINCLRLLPYVRAWDAKYKDRGLVVIGVETPEFAFEKDPGNVRTALTNLGVNYPVATDNDFGIWQAFNNEAWPALYFFDATGHLRRQMFGEGEYDQSERLIQKLLAQAGDAPVANDLTAANGQGLQAPPDLSDLQSPETYVGFAQARNFASPGGIREAVPSLYRPESTLPLNFWGLSGVWTVGSEYALLRGPSGKITFRFHARDLHLIMLPDTPGHTIRFRVMIDGAPPAASHGTDVDAGGWGTVREARLYQLIRQAGPVRDRTFEIEFFQAGVRAYDFTFG